MTAVAPKSRPGHRELLLDGAMRCLREKGYARTTARELVAASGTNLASIGYHFGSKEALLDEAIARGFDQWAEEVERAMFAIPDASAAERFAVSLDAMIGRFEELRPYLVAFVEALPRALRSAELRQTLAAAYARCREAGARMVSAALAGEGSELSRHQARNLAAVGMAICDGLMIQWLLDPDATPGAAQVIESLGLALSIAAPRAAQPATAPRVT
jgi:AcrR family transcriptional regulator